VAKKLSSERVIAKLRQIEVLVGQGREDEAHDPPQQVRLAGADHAAHPLSPRRDTQKSTARTAASAAIVIPPLLDR
jgi:hypothetical protein